ncbi:hypothetical protein KQX54_019039 [Cotesia glomerata]|uniref:Uncharacterized protein n=1 Tax=Cotesia glomerata TaxID=32391 RepID=A0AAV7IU53_COTGL|nr:hypothetical protein KQX54_019039 [Cotesia glomerata]
MFFRINDASTDLSDQQQGQNQGTGETPETRDTESQIGPIDLTGNSGKNKTPERNIQALQQQQTQDTVQGEIEGSKKVEEPGSSVTLDEDIMKILGQAPETGEACQKIHADIASMDKLTHDLKVQPQKKSLTSSSGNWNGSSVPRRPTIVTSQKFKPQTPKSAAQKLPARLSSQSRSNQTPSQSYRRRHLSNSSSTSRSRTH